MDATHSPTRGQGSPPPDPPASRRRAARKRLNLTSHSEHALARAGMRVLVVDDDQNLRELLAMALLEEGYQVSSAADGAAALAQVRDYQPDVILLDMQMPVMDGPTFAERYHQLPGPHAPIVVFTAAGCARGWASNLPAAAFLDKPFDLPAVAAILRRAAPNPPRALANP
ncbi:MAG: response regulator [Chloroflexota bacterium]|nr:response regulator [Chloroflexota bacterium]